jgi:nicotinamidase/pyrazinamidase
MTSALLIIDLQNDFTEKIAGGREVAARVTDHLRAHGGDYDLVVASRDWHDAEGSNGGHFPAAPEGSDHPYVRHCVAGSRGAEYDAAFDADRVDVHIKKGQGIPGYSLYEGITADGTAFPEFLRDHSVDRVTVVGLATEFCVRAAALDSLQAGYEVTVLTDLIGGIDPERSAAALAEIETAGGTIG